MILFVSLLLLTIEVVMLDKHTSPCQIGFLTLKIVWFTRKLELSKTKAHSLALHAGLEESEESQSR